jgi:peptide/nickel transport system permease protein
MVASTEQKVRQTAVVELGVPEDELYSRSLTQLAFRRLRRDYLTLAALTVILIFSTLAILAPAISKALDVNYYAVDMPNTFQKIGAPGHPLGTDDLGRDHLSRLLYGGRVSLGIAASAATLSIMIGVALGLLAGYYQGGRLRIIDDLLTWFITTLNSVPFLFLLLIISAVLTRSVFSLILILGVLGWTGTMRLVRGETLSQREREYIVSARAIGASDTRIMFTHILPNIFSIIIINLALDIGVLILIESGLSFLNLGVVPPTPSWGNMLSNAQTFFTKGVHLVIAPGVLIVITVLCFYLIGDGLRDAFDPQSVRQR